MADMNRYAPRIARMLRGEEGVTLVELMVSMAIFTIVMVVFLTTLVTVQRAVSSEDAKTRNNDQARLAVEELDREIRSGNVLYKPEDEGYALRIYTQSNAPTRRLTDSDLGYVCRQWQITPAYELQTRFWDPRHPELPPSAWLSVATGIVNRRFSTPPFELSTDPNQGGDPTTGEGARTVEIVLLVNGNWETRSGDTVRIETSITGRNTLNGFPEHVCDLPTGT